MVNILNLNREEEKQSSLPTSTFQDTDVFQSQSSTLSPTSTTDQQKFLDGLDDSQYNKMVSYHKQGYSFDQAKDMLTSNKQEQQNYLNNLSDEQYGQMMSYYNQGYSFEEAQNKLQGIGQNTIQQSNGGGIRGQINQASKSDTLLGEIADNVTEGFNMVGNTFERLDEKAQELLPNQSVNERQKELQKKVDSLSQDQKAQYQKEWNDLGDSVKEYYGNLNNYMKAQEQGFVDSLLDTWKETDDGFNIKNIILNTPSSLLKTATAIARGVTNPYDTVSGIKELGVDLWDNGWDSILAQEYGSLEGWTNALQNDPVGRLSDLLGAGGLATAGAKAGIKGAIKMGVKDSAKLTKTAENLGSLASKLDNLSDLGITNSYNKILDKGLEYAGKSGSKLVRGAGKAVELSQRPLRALGKSIFKDGSKLNQGNQNIEVTPGVTENASKVTEGFLTKVKNNFSSGLGADNRLKMYSNRYFAPIAKRIMNDIDSNGAPMRESQMGVKYYNELADNVMKTLDTYAENLEETGKIYEQLKNSGVRVDLTPSQMKIRQYLRENGVNPVPTQNGKYELRFANDSRLLPIERNQIQMAFDWIMNTNFKNIDWENYHGLRKDIDKKLVKWDNAGRQEQQEIVKGMRKIMNEEAHEKFPGMKDADKLYSKEVEEIDNLKYNLVYRSGPKKGDYKDNIGQHLKTIINTNKDGMRDRLKKIIPDIGEMSEAIELATKYGKAYQGSPALMKVLGKIGGAIAGISTGSLWGFIAGSVIDEFFTKRLGEKLRKKVLQEIADNIPESTQKELADIFIRDASGWELFEGEKQLRDQAIQEIVEATAKITGEEKPESLKTKAEKQTQYNQQRVKKDRGVETQGGDEYIVIDGKKVWNKKPEGYNDRDRRMQQFTNDKILPIERKNEKYVNSMNKLLQGKSENAEVGEGITMGKDALQHIYEGHGAFAPENLVETVNNADGIVEHPFESENIEYRLKKIPGTNNFFKAVVETRDGKQVTTFFEKVTGNEKAFENEMKKATKPLEEKPGYKKEEMEEIVQSISSDGVGDKVQPNSTDNSIAKNGKNAREVGDFIDEMNETAKNTGKMDTLDYSRMSDEGLNALLEEKNLPKQERKTIEDILERRMQKEMQREAERGEKVSQFGVKDEVEFVRRAHQLQEMEKNIGKVGGKKVKDSTFKENQRKEREKKREKLIEEIGETYGIDQFEAYNRYLDFENAGVESEQYTQRGGTKKKNDYDTEVQELLNKKKEEWSKQPQHIREMDDYEKQVRQDLIDSRGDGYEVRERDGGDAFIKNGDIIGRWNYKDGQISEIIFSTDDGFDAIMNNKRFLRNLPDDTVIHKQGEELSATAKELRDVKYGNEEKGKTMYQIAYHGGPNSFDRFDLSHIGNGLQAHGYGHYVAFNENVANSYANGKNLYTLDIPDEVKKNTPTGTNYLDEQKAYSENQYDKIFEELKKKEQLSEKQKTDIEEYIDAYRNSKGLTGENVYRIIKRTLGNKQKASEFLNSLGYDGIKYKDRNDGPCAVLFTDEAMNIVNHEKYQISDQTKTPEFKKRFEGSKVVDENGNPLVVYHGTNAKFNTFDGIKTEPGYRFTEDFDYAKEHGDNVKSVYLNIKNVADLDTMRELGKEKFGDNVGEKQLLSNEFKDYLIEKGYDGMVWDHDGKNTYIAFNPNQIKSATDNIGTFDPNNPDIRYQKFGVAKQGEKGITAQEGLGMKNFKNGRSVEEIAKHYGIETKIVDQILTPNGDKALGSYGDGLIKLAKDLKESTVPHELLHATFDMVDSQTKQKILDVVKKKLEREGKMEGIKDKDLNAEERLADSFSEYFRTGKFEDRTRPKGVMNKIKEFFKRVKDFITGVYKEKNQIKKLFDDILDEKIKAEKSTSQTQYQSAGDIYSKNFKDRFGDWENDPKNASKVVDENGNPQIMYHGTPNAGFTTFKGGGYFTKNKEYADHYQNPNASSLTFNKKTGTPGTYAVYLNIKKPFDTRNQDAKRIFEEEYYGNYGMGTPLGDKGLPDRMDGTDLQEFLEQYHPEYDGLILDEGAIGGYGEEVKDRGESYVPFNPNQIKSATDNNGNFSKTDDDIRHQMAYHGSKADFDKFDSSHIGEGQGAQVHGRGHYVTKNPENAKFYAKDNLMFKGYQTHQLDSLKDFPPEGYAVITNIEDLYKDGYGTIKDCIENNQRVYDREVKRLQEEVKQDDNSYTRGLLERTEKRKKVADSLKPEDFKIPSRNFYEIDIPDPIKTDTPTGSNYLDENKKITPKQYEKFKILLNDYIKENNLPSRSLDVKYEDLTSRGKAGVGGGGSAIYDVIETILGSDKKASEFLNELGYDGIKYKDGRDGDSYVIFNDDKMNIKSHEKFQVDENIKQNSEKLMNENFEPDAETAKEIRNIFNKYSNTLDAINTKFADYYQGTNLTEYRGQQEKLYGIIGETYDPDVEKRQKNIYKKMGEIEDESALEKTSNGRKDVQQETVDTQDLTSLQSMFKELEQYEKYNKWIQSEPVPGPTKAFDSKGIYQDYLKVKANTPQKKKETVQKLVAISNMKEERFKQIIKDNGKIPMPSITIMNPNIHHVDFGEIQMVFGKNTVDPKTNKDNIIYGTDAYTPTFGNLAKNIVTKDDGSFINGNQFKDGKERPVTPENVLKAMQEGQKPVVINVRPGSYKDMIQVMGSKIDDLEDVRKKNFADFKFHEIIDQIQDLNKKYNKQVEQLKEEGNYQGENIRADIKRTYNTDAKEFARKLNSQMNNRVSEETVQGLIDTIEKGRNSSIRFSESKPQRIVDVYNEVEYVLVPKNMVDGIKDLVKGTPLENKIQSYSSQGGDNRLDVTRTKKLHELQKKYGNVFFSMGGLVMPIAYLLQMMNGEDEGGQEA